MVVVHFFLLGQFFEFLFKRFIVVGAEHDETAHLGLGIGDRGGVDFLDQTGQAVGDFAGEDHRDRVVAVHSDLAEFLVGHGTRHVQRVADAPRHSRRRLGAVPRGL